MTTSWKHIMVPIDFTPESREALRFAIAMFPRDDQRITLMHVVEPEFWLARGNAVSMLLQKSDAELRLEAHERLWRWVLLENIPDHRVDVVVATGGAAREIVRRARLAPCDVIVVGRRQQPAWAHVFSAGVGREIQRIAPCPVLTLQVAAPAIDVAAVAASPAPGPQAEPSRSARRFAAI